MARCCVLLLLCVPLLNAFCGEDKDLVGDLLGELKDLGAWSQKEFRYRQRFTLVRGPKTENPDLVVVNDLSVKRLQAAEKMGSRIVAVADEGDELPMFYLPAEDVCVVRLTQTMLNRENVTVAMYYGDVGALKMPAPLKKITDVHRSYTAYPWMEESRDPEPADGPSALAKKFIERYQRLVLIEPEGGKAEPLAGANAGNISRFEANAGAVKSGPFTLNSDGAHLIRVRVHAAAAVDGSLKLTLTGQGAPSILELPCKGQGFFWCETQADLKKGEYASATVQAPAELKAGVDFVLLSPDVNWKPEYDALSGPIWVRYRIVKDGTPPNSIEMSATYSTYTVDGPQSKPDGEFFANAWFYNPRFKALRPKNSIKPAFAPGQWTPWGRLLESGSWTWQETAIFHGGNAKTVDIQFAFGPTEGKVFRHNRTQCADNRFSFRMPTMPNNFNEAMFCARTMEDFLDWRLGEAAKFKLEPGHQLKKIYFSVFPYGPEATNALEEKRVGLFEVMGFNGLDQGDNAHAELYKKHGMVHHHLHHWINESGADWAKLPGENYTQKMASYRDEVLRTIKSGKWIGPVPQFGKFNILVDEPGPFVEEGSFSDKAMEQLFIAYLKEKKAEPALFGLKSFDEFRWPKPGMSKAQARAARAAAVQQIVNQNTGEITLKPDTEFDVILDEKDAKDAKEREEKKKKELEVLGNKQATDAFALDQYTKGVKLVPDPASREGKRLRWFIRQFQSDFSGRVCSAIAEATYKESPTQIYSGPNFQAEPVWSGFMWEGGLDLLQYGRVQTPGSFIQIEDWAWSGAYVDCAFAGALIRAACRPSGAFPAALVTGGRTRTKIMGWLSQGIRKFDSYLYGPMHAIGPPWADDPLTYQNMGGCIHEMQRVEDDIVACKHMSEIAELVANTTEIIRKTTNDRRGMFRNAILAGHGIDLVSEEDVELDNLLAKYKVLLVPDAGVRRSVQAAIKKWVEDGGRAVISNGACAFDEFEEPCDVLGALKPKDAKTPVTLGKGSLLFLTDKDSAKPSVDAMIAFVRESGVKPQWSSDCPGLWATATVGEKRQVVYVIKGVAPEQNAVKMQLFRATKPTEVFSSRLNKAIPFEFADGVVSFSFDLPPCPGLANLGLYPSTDILVIRE